MSRVIHAPGPAIPAVRAGCEDPYWGSMGNIADRLLSDHCANGRPGAGDTPVSAASSGCPSLKALVLNIARPPPSSTVPVIACRSVYRTPKGQGRATGFGPTEYTSMRIQPALRMTPHPHTSNFTSSDQVRESVPTYAGATSHHPKNSDRNVIDSDGRSSRMNDAGPSCPRWTPR